MAPKSKQIARRTRAEGKGKGKGASRGLRPQGFEDLDARYEKELFEQLPLQARIDVADVGQVLMNTYDGMPPEIAGPSANRIRREQRELFDNILRDARDADTNSGEDFARAAYESAPPHIRDEIDQVGLENRRRGLSVNQAFREALVTVLERPNSVDQELRARGYTGSYVDENNVRQPIFEKGKGQGKGFEPFSGKGRRLDDDLNSLD